jgi:hypothetical protein
LQYNSIKPWYPSGRLFLPVTVSDLVSYAAS